MDGLYYFCRNERRLIMPEKKKQHYVPKFYLRFFSLENSSKHIKLCLKKNGKTIDKADLEGQAQETYFYGKDLEREKWFENIEDKVAVVFREVVETKNLPKNKSDNYYWIWLFMLLQSYRTRSNANEFNNVVDTTLKTAMRLEPKFKDFDFETHFFAYDNAIEKSLDLLLRSLPMLMDMQIKLLFNKTSKELITSDNPISKYNQFLESRKFPYGHTGMASKGLQIFYPLAPDLVLIMFDPKVYKVGNKKQFDRIKISIEDVIALNMLTCLHANKSLYGTDKITNYDFEKILENAIKFENQKTIDVHHFDPVPEGEDTESMIVQHHRTPYLVNLQLTFIKQTPHAKSYKMSGYYAELRNEHYREAKNRPNS